MVTCRRRNVMFYRATSEMFFKIVYYIFSVKREKY